MEKHLEELFVEIFNDEKHFKEIDGVNMQINKRLKDARPIKVLSDVHKIKKLPKEVAKTVIDEILFKA